ncbi:tubulin-specific chaperone E [Sporormia fimetaria CBS 119925]|uniref:Tubulin-specific chaperone E n=1 Tax=Sporormia fimetaria CBS 119925 TaxID=1340428 RepID=A0A6A6V733_9PLEO|nr:tubulin-specific chaperone E [Sporormia fimetaria CBS 119925]
MSKAFYVGKRLSFDGQLCTVRYHGEVQGTKGEWLGVEWDDASRGKHSGEHAGVKYFECISKSATAASFVRPTRRPDPERSFLEALKAKYVSETINMPKAQMPEQQDRTIRISGKEVEELGFDKIREQLADLKELRIVILDGLCMSRPLARRRETGSDVVGWPEATDIKESCPKITELDLSRNLFEDWREVASICEQLDRLKSLRVDGNRFTSISLCPVEVERCQRAFRNVKSLKLENCLLTWEKIAKITILFPSLTTFSAANNAYDTLSEHYPASTITDLSLEDNEISYISDLHPLTKLPNLQRLILKFNKISDIIRPDATLPTFSPTLKEVDLSYNSIITWSFYHTLETVFPGLTSLRVSHNPLYQSLRAADGRALTAEDGYMLTLARLGNLKTLNFSPISAKERLNAESYYLSLIARELNFSSPEEAARILASHPRYAYLCEEYGEPVINRTAGTLNPNSLAARLIRFTFYLGASAQVFLGQAPSEETSKFETEIPKSCTAYTLLGVVGKHFGISPIKCRLIWETGDWLPAPRDEDTADSDWESDSDGEGADTEDGGKSAREKVMREVEIVPGTRAVGNWVDGMEVTVRVEVR